MITLAVLLAIRVLSQNSPDQMMELALANHERYKAIIQATLDYDKNETVEELDGNGNPKRVIPDGDAKDRNKIQMSIAKLLKPGRYKYSIGASTAINGRPVFRIDFTPNDPDKLPAPDPRVGEGIIIQEMEAGLNDVLNSLNGTVYLDKETLGIVRLDAELPDTVFRKMVWISKTKITYDQMYLLGIWVPAKTVSDIRSAKFFPRPRQYQRRTIRFSNYRFKAPQ